MKEFLAALIFMTITFVMFTRTLPGPDPLSKLLNSELSNLERLL